MNTDRLPYDASGCKAFLARHHAELSKWWTKRYLGHWIPRIRHGLWMFRNSYLITKCVLEQGKRLQKEEEAGERSH